MFSNLVSSTFLDFDKLLISIALVLALVGVLDLDLFDTADFSTRLF
jgi:hypothetical protein